MLSQSDKVWCSIGATVNVGNYESIKVDCGLTMDRSEFDSLEDAKAAVLREAIEMAQTAIDVAVETIDLRKK